jgi:hypothetical protein
MNPILALYRNNTGTFSKHFRYEIVPFITGGRRQCPPVINWFEMAQNESNPVIPAGVEPTTHRLEICCSIQLSYGISFIKGRGGQIRTAGLHVPNVAR